MKKKVTVIIISAIFLLVSFMAIKFYYFDTYLMALNGRVEFIRTDIKQSMYVTISKKEHNLSHFWPKFQENVRIGDSVYKEPKKYEIILIKKGTHERIICTYDY